MMPIMTYTSFGAYRRMRRFRGGGCRVVTRLYDENIIKNYFSINSLLSYFDKNSKYLNKAFIKAS